MVWEWASESFILSQQSHFSGISCIAYSQDGMKIATGGEDGKLKIWNANSGFCFKTFSEHNAEITDVTFTGRDSSVVVTSSLDGTIRCFDLKRYRNFRTMMVEGIRPGDHAQLTCVACDPSGELIATSSSDTYEVYLFNMRTGKLLERFSGHEAPVSQVAFHPCKPELASCSWDGSLMVRHIFAKKKESPQELNIGGDLLGLCYKLDGEQLAVSSNKGEISIIRTKDEYTVEKSIPVGRDIKVGRQDGDEFAGKKRQGQAAFSKIAFSSNGKHLFCGGGNALEGCMYDVSSGMLLKRFETTPSRSQTGASEVLRKRLDKVIDEEDTLKLPGVRKGDVGIKNTPPEAGLKTIALSPTGDQLALVNSTCVDIWKSGNESVGMNVSFAPITLDEETTPDKVEKSILERDFSKALKTSLALNSHVLIRNSIETFASKNVDNENMIDDSNNASSNAVRLLLTQLSTQEVTLLMDFVGGELKTTRHLQFYLILAQTIVLYFGCNLKDSKPIALCTKLQKSLLDRKNLLMRLFEENGSRIDYLLDMKNLKLKEEVEEESGDSDGDEMIENESAESESENGENEENEIQLTETNEMEVLMT